MFSLFVIQRFYPIQYQRCGEAKYTGTLDVGECLNGRNLCISSSDCFCFLSEIRSKVITCAWQEVLDTFPHVYITVITVLQN